MRIYKTLLITAFLLAFLFTNGVGQQRVREMPALKIRGNLEDTGLRRTAILGWFWR